MEDQILKSEIESILEPLKNFNDTDEIYNANLIDNLDLNKYFKINNLSSYVECKIKKNNKKFVKKQNNKILYFQKHTKNVCIKSKNDNLW